MFHTVNLSVYFSSILKALFLNYDILPWAMSNKVPATEVFILSVSAQIILLPNHV